MKYGYFDDKKKENVITNPRTSVKWINYITTLAFGGFVSDTDSTATYKGTPGLNRITSYIQQMPSSNFKSELILVHKKNQARTHKVFAPFFMPYFISNDKDGSPLSSKDKLKLISFQLLNILISTYRGSLTMRTGFPKPCSYK